MSKSHEPFRPEDTRQRERPEWVADADRFTRIATDDAEFGVCYVRPSASRQTKREVAWCDGRGRWHKTVVDWRRVKEVA